MCQFNLFRECLYYDLVIFLFGNDGGVGGSFPRLNVGDSQNRRCETQPNLEDSIEDDPRRMGELLVGLGNVDVLGIDDRGGSAAGRARTPPGAEAAEIGEPADRPVRSPCQNRREPPVTHIGLSNLDGVLDPGPRGADPSVRVDFEDLLTKKFPRDQT